VGSDARGRPALSASDILKTFKSLKNARGRPALSASDILKTFKSLKNARSRPALSARDILRTFKNLKSQLSENVSNKLEGFSAPDPQSTHVARSESEHSPESMKEPVRRSGKGRRGLDSRKEGGTQRMHAQHESTAQRAGGQQQHRDSYGESAVPQSLKRSCTLRGWVEEVHQEGHKNEGVSGKFILNMLTNLPGISEGRAQCPRAAARLQTVYVALALLARKAREQDGDLAGHLKKFADCISSSRVLLGAFQPGSELFEAVQDLMKAAAADPRTYSSARECNQVASAQRKLRLPCLEYWSTLSEKGVPRTVSGADQSGNLTCRPEDSFISTSINLMRCRVHLTTNCSMPLPSPALWHTLLSATCQAFGEHQGAKPLPDKQACRSLCSLLEALRSGFPAVTQGSPCAELLRNTALKFVELVAHVNDPTLWSVPTMCQVIAMHHRLGLLLNDKAMLKIRDVVVRACPRMHSYQVAVIACAWSYAGLSFKTRAGFALKVAIIRNLPMMKGYWLHKVINSLRAARLEPDERAWEALQESVAHAAPEAGPQMFARIASAFARLLDDWMMSPDEHTADALLAAAQRTAPMMTALNLSSTISAFSLIPLPLDSPAGQAVLSELQRRFGEMNMKDVKNTLIGLCAARQPISEPVFGALWNALIRVAPSIMPEDLESVLCCITYLQRPTFVPNEVRVVLLQAVSRCAPWLTGLEGTLKWLNILKWEVPDEVAALRFLRGTLANEGENDAQVLKHPRVGSLR
jgi:hypothetical protein